MKIVQISLKCTTCK